MSCVAEGAQQKKSTHKIPLANNKNHFHTFADDSKVKAICQSHFRLDCSSVLLFFCSEIPFDNLIFSKSINMLNVLAKTERKK